MRKLPFLLIIPILLAACSPAPAQSTAILDSITLSHGLGPDYRPLAPTARFAADEKFYCAALMRGLSPNMVVSARWVYADKDQLIKRTDYVVKQTGNGYVGFELANDRPPWPSGRYRVEILVDHRTAGSADFTVP